MRCPISLYCWILRALWLHPVGREVIIVGVYIFKLMKFKTAILILWLIVPARILIGLEHIILIVCDLRECECDRLPAVLEARYFVFGCYVFRMILLDLAMHLIVSFFTSASHNTTADEDANNENESTTASSGIDHPHWKEGLFPKTERSRRTIISCLDEQICPARVRDVLRVPCIPKFVGINICCHLLDQESIIKDWFIEPRMHPHSIYKRRLGVSQWFDP